uniref:Uncharacterized protein n=1 Tax=Panagrolaimus superbus TaxID=310955 RepID=A0A914YN01_9BILA
MEQEDPDNSVAFDIFEKSTRLVDERFEVGVRWKLTKKPLHSNLGLAHGRLSSVYKKLKERQKGLEEYDGKFKVQVEQEIIEAVEGESEDGEIVQFLPLLPIPKPKKPATKLRIVFGGYEKPCKDNPSINENLPCQKIHDGSGRKNEKFSSKQNDAKILSKWKVIDGEACYDPDIVPVFKAKLAFMKAYYGIVAAETVVAINVKEAIVPCWKM